ncbi:vacuolar-sorting protein SNF8 [Manacus vitellinus]|uniref:vacuolar-sorting protein SNF8 n=1 Tax=Manacus vitellinus TaxID=328815 RepID=UPI00115F1596|nr:vacuolar-sorting protein SNF8 [Manacus vitellinus]
MSKQLDMFKTNLEEFASKHKQEIRKNPEFRVQFQDMCATIGVDPLASGKGFWSEMLGVGDFYYELGVQIIEVCLALKHRNGGLITLEELHQQVLKGRGKFAQDVSQDDLLRAIKKLKVLGNGFGIIPVGGTFLIQSVPAELNMDHTVVLQLAEKKGFVTVSEIKSSLKWETERAKQVLVRGGLVVDPVGTARCRQGRSHHSRCGVVEGAAEHFLVGGSGFRLLGETSGSNSRPTCGRPGRTRCSRTA